MIFFFPSHLILKIVICVMLWNCKPSVLLMGILLAFQLGQWWMVVQMWKPAPPTMRRPQRSLCLALTQGWSNRLLYRPSEISRQSSQLAVLVCSLCFSPSCDSIVCSSRSKDLSGYQSIYLILGHKIRRQCTLKTGSDSFIIIARVRNLHKWPQKHTVTIVHQQGCS